MTTIISIKLKNNHAVIVGDKQTVFAVLKQKIEQGLEPQTITIAKINLGNLEAQQKRHEFYKDCQGAIVNNMNICGDVEWFSYSFDGGSIEAKEIEL